MVATALTSLVDKLISPYTVGIPQRSVLPLTTLCGSVYSEKPSTLDIQKQYFVAAQQSPGCYHSPRQGWPWTCLSETMRNPNGTSSDDSPRLVVAGCPSFQTLKCGHLMSLRTCNHCVCSSPVCSAFVEDKSSDHSSKMDTNQTKHSP